MPPGPEHRGRARGGEEQTDDTPGEGPVVTVVGVAAPRAPERSASHEQPENADAEAGAERDDILRRPWFGIHSCNPDKVIGQREHTGRQTTRARIAAAPATRSSWQAIEEARRWRYGLQFCRKARGYGSDAARCRRTPRCSAEPGPWWFPRSIATTRSASCWMANNRSAGSRSTSWKWCRSLRCRRSERVRSGVR